MNLADFQAIPKNPTGGTINNATILVVPGCLSIGKPNWNPLDCEISSVIKSQINLLIIITLYWSLSVVCEEIKCKDFPTNKLPKEVDDY